MDRQPGPVVPGGGMAGHRRPISVLPDVLDVIAVVSNPARYCSRYDLFRAFEAHARAAGCRLTVVEMAYGSRPYEVTTPDDPSNVQVRSACDMWHKENLINIGLSRLPRDWRYAAWVDADLTFARPDWVQETLQQLQRHSVVQMFAEAHDLGPDGMVLNSFRSFAWSHAHGVARTRGVGAGYYGGVPSLGIGSRRIAYWHHPGFAWAARREAIDAIGGLFDVAVVGEADFIMAKSMMGEAVDVLYPGVSPGYRKAVLGWQSRALKLRGDMGYVPGTVLHHWHGPKASRKYWDRCRILAETQFDPGVDLCRDWQGLYRLRDADTPRLALLRDSLRAYFLGRDEDSTVV